MSMTEHHIFSTAPGFGPLCASVARGLAQGRAELAAAGYGPAVLGPHAAGRIHLDETLMGRAAAGLTGFFPMAPLRMRRFAEKIQGPVGRLVVVVQPYDVYFPQVWRHQAQRRAMPDFADLVPALSNESRGWADIVAEMQAEFCPRELVILPTPVTPSEALAALVPGVMLALEPSGPAQVPDTGIAMLQRLFRAGVNIAPRQAQRLMSFHVQQPQPAPLAAFSVLEAARLRRRYARDLERIAAMPGVRIGALTSLTPLAIAAE
jgi:hypothetical protein